MKAMKNFKYAILMATAIVLGFSSCSSDDENGGGTDNGQPKSVYLKIASDPATYSEGPSVTNDATVGFSSGELFFVNGSGAILGHYTISTGATSATNINIGDITSTGTTLSNLSGGISAVHIVGNVPPGITLPTTGNISTVKAQVLGVATQSDITKVNLYGDNALTLVSGNQYTTTVTLKPTVARIELANIKAGGVITGFEVEGIFIDNYYKEGKVDGSLGALVSNGTTPAIFTDGSTEYPTALKPAIYDWYSTALATTGGVVAPATGVWNYNVFATTAGSTVPRIIIRLKNFTTSNSSTISSPQFVSIKGLKENGTSLSAIKAGEIYSITAGVLQIDETVITPNPNQSTIDVEVKVELAKWKVVDVTPEL